MEKNGFKDLSPSLRPVVNAAVEAMKAGKCLEVVYHGECRLVEVHAVGLSTSGNPCVRVYQVIGGSVFSATKGWKMLSLKDVESFQVLNVPSQGPRPGYNPGDKGMSDILAEISDEPVPAKANDPY